MRGHPNWVIVFNALWLLLRHAGLSGTREARRVEAWLEQFDPGALRETDQ